MDVPRILAISDVHLTAPVAAAGEVGWFYVELIGLEPVVAKAAQVDDDRVLTFRGWPKSGAKLVVDLLADAPERSVRTRLRLQVASVLVLADQIADRGGIIEWSHGWSFYDRRLTTFDPAGHRVELAAFHPW